MTLTFGPNQCDPGPGKYTISFWSNKLKYLPAFTRFLGYCLLWPWPLTSKANIHVYEPTYTCDQNWMKFPSLVLRYGVHNGFWSLTAVTLTVDLMTLSVCCRPWHIHH